MSVMTCGCLDRIDEKLKPYNTRVAVGLALNGEVYIQVATCKADIEKRVKPKTLYASYCPFCGEKGKEK